jgi:GntR family transcriptional regulator
MIDRYDPKPLHIQIEEFIRAKLDSGEWAINQAIPSENELSRTYGISRMTVRSAISRLVHDGLLNRIPGKGTFVNEPKVVASSSYSGFRNLLEHMGPNITNEIISFNIRTVDEETASKFDLPIHYKFYVIEKVRYKNKLPLSLHTTYIPEHLAYGLTKDDVYNEHLQQVMREKFRLSHTKVIETLESVPATETEAMLLKVPKDYTLLLLNDFLYMGDIPYEFSRIVFRGDKVQLKFEFV